MTGGMAWSSPATTMFRAKASDQACGFQAMTAMIRPPVSRARRTSSFLTMAPKVSTVTAAAMAYMSIVTLLSGPKAFC